MNAWFLERGKACFHSRSGQPRGPQGRGPRAAPAAAADRGDRRAEGVPSGLFYNKTANRTEPPPPPSSGGSSGRGGGGGQTVKLAGFFWEANVVPPVPCFSLLELSGTRTSILGKERRGPSYLHLLDFHSQSPMATAPMAEARHHSSPPPPTG